VVMADFRDHVRVAVVADDSIRDDELPHFNSHEDPRGDFRTVRAEITPGIITALS
jgi:hypothetical protein